MSNTINISDQEFDISIDSLKLYYILDPNELKRLKEFKNLTYLGLGSSNIDDKGLKYISESQSIQNINLQCTEITDIGIAYLVQLKSLNILRLKECDYISNYSVQHFNNMENLVDLQIHDTNIDQNGLNNLDSTKLTFLSIQVWNDNFSYDFLIKYSAKYPNCEILVKGKGTFLRGAFNGDW